MAETEDDDLRFQRSAVYALEELRKEEVVISRLCIEVSSAGRFRDRHKQLQRHVHRIGELVSVALGNRSR